MTGNKKNLSGFLLGHWELISPVN